jgi:hypothetical protein
LGAWGPGVLEDDLSLDVYEEFIRAFQNHATAKDIEKLLYASWKTSVIGTDEEINFWLGMAQAEWECGVLTKRVLSKVRSCIDSRMDAHLWLHESDKEKRDSAVEAFWKKISTPNADVKISTMESAKKTAPLKVGTCLSIKLGERQYGGVIVMEVSEGKNTFWYRLVALDGTFESPPTIDFFKMREWLFESPPKNLDTDETDRLISLLDKFNVALPSKPAGEKKVHRQEWCDSKSLLSAGTNLIDVGTIELLATDPVAGPRKTLGVAITNWESVRDLLLRYSSLKSS